ncbi:hypothetical protein AVEN_9392-1 [Araneus ventricosus]|uniref:Uncharacterized protein n=1 Tax=Araneus ventricosus TaxID=182803 RepID=A0A4Y2DLD0_ARAVE|nr:hypothetical protein AVEN_9392-1 [Araneus ventricosus]
MLENHTFDKKSGKPPGDHRLAALLNTRGTDVFNFELDKQKKHSCQGVSLNCPGKDYLLAIREIHVGQHKSITPSSELYFQRPSIDGGDVAFPEETSSRPALREAAIPASAISSEGKHRCGLSDGFPALISIGRYPE